MYSFYGGKQGRTYHIVERFDLLYIDFSNTEEYPPYSSGSSYSAGDLIQYTNKLYRVLLDGVVTDLTETSTQVVLIKGMVNYFQQGGAYTDVNYGLYVIIDTILNFNHKSDDINGLLYRRGLDYTEDASFSTRPLKDDKDENGELIYYDNGHFLESKWRAAWNKYITTPGGGAIYVGQIVGPQGDSPELIGLSWSEYLSHSTAAIHSDPVNTTTLDQTPGMYETPSSELGQPSTISFNDEIKLGSATIRDQEGLAYGAHIAFDIPYPVFNIQSTVVSPYFGDNVTHTEITGNSTAWTTSSDNLVHEYDYSINSAVHPYFHDLQIAVPHGKQGDSIDSLSVGQYITIEEEGQLKLVSTTLGGLSYLLYVKRKYDNSALGSTQLALPISKYNVISTVLTLASTRSIIRNEEEAFLDDITVGTIFIPSSYSTLKFIALTQGRIVIGNLPEEQNIQEGTVITTAPEEQESGITYALLLAVKLPEPATAALKTSYTASEDSIANFNNLDYWYITPLGEIYCVYTKTVLGNNGNDPVRLTQLKQIDDVLWNNGIDKDGTLEVNYNVGSSYQSLLNNMVIGIDRQGDNIILLYSNRNFRQKYLTSTISVINPEDPEGENLTEQKYSQGIDYYLLPCSQDTIDKFNLQFSDDDFISFDSLTGEPTGGGDDNNGNLVWINFGPLASGYHVDGHYTVDEVQSLIPNGFGAVEGLESLAGWTISVSSVSGAAPDGLYAYDYKYVRDPSSGRSAPVSSYIVFTDNNGSTTSNWYRIKELDLSSIEPSLSVYLGNSTADAKNSLNLNGLAFLVSTVHSHNEQQGT